MSIQYSEGRNKETARPNFSMEAVENKSASEKEGRPIFEEKEMVEIRIPGDRLMTWKGEVDDSHKKRFPEAYAAFKRGAERAATGTPLDEWPPLSKSRVLELKAANILSVEELADIPDSILPKIGMGARAEREKARAFLASAAGNASTSALASENADLKRRLEVLEAAMLGKPEVFAEPIVKEDKAIEDCSDDELKAYIKKHTGEGVRGNPSRDTLLRKSAEIAQSDGGLD